jgi:hypothetical protein
MSQYTNEGIKTKSRFFTWDRVEIANIGGNKVERRRIKIRKGMPVIHTHSLGMITNSDVGRILVVDVYNNGDIIDYFSV